MVDYTDTSVSDLIVNKLTYAKYIELKNAGTLQANQLYEITDPENMGGSTTWGAIGGTLSNQTDLNTALSGKQATLVSGTNIKTVNSTSLLGSGNVTVQPTLVSGTNIKTINNTSILGSGNIAVQAAITGGATTITGSNLTVNRALISNASGKVAVSATTSTELGYLSGVTSAVQTQLNAKQGTLTAGAGISIANNTISVTSSASIPVGTIMPYGGSKAPSGFLLCDGSAVSRTTYSALHAVIGTTYGAGDGNTTFNLPNLNSIVTNVNTSAPVKGTGMTLGLTNGSANYGIRNGGGNAFLVETSTASYNTTVGSVNAGGSTGTANNSLGVITDSSKSGITATVIRTQITCKYCIKY